MKKFLPYLLLIIITSFGLNAVAQTPTFNNGGLKVNGEILTQYASGSTLYLGGSFTGVNAVTGPVAIINSSNYQPSVNPLFKNISGTINSVCSDGSGGMILGGSFSYYTGSSYYYYLIRVSSTGTVIPLSTSFGGLSMVNKVLTYGGKLYALHNNGVFRYSLATNTQENWNIGQLTGQAYDAEIDLTNSPNRMYIGGYFNISGSYRPLVRINLSTSAYEFTWAPSITSSSSGSNSAAIYALELVNNNLYFGGSNINLLFGQVRKNFGAFNPITGVASGIACQFTSTVRSLAYVGGTYSLMYVGGEFTQVRNNVSSTYVSKPYLASITCSGLGQLNSNFSPNPNSSVYSVYYDAATNTLLTGGSFTTVQGQSKGRGALFNSANGLVPVLNSTFTPNANGIIKFIGKVNSQIVLGGGFTELEVMKRNRILALDMNTGLPSSFAPDIRNGAVYAIVSDANAVFVGGYFSDVEGNSRSNFTGFNPVSGAEKAGLKINFNGTVRSLALNNYLWAGGDFTNFTVGTSTTVNNRNYVAMFAPFSNSIAFYSPFNASLQSPSTVAAVNVVRYINGQIFLGGRFESPRKYLMSVFSNAGSVTNFDARFNQSTNNTWVHDIIQTGTGEIAACGYFGGGIAQNVYSPSGTVNYGPGSIGGLATFNSTNGNLLYRNTNQSGEVLKLAKPTPSTIEYTIGNTLWSVNPATQTNTALTGGISGTVRCINYYNSRYYYGGIFTSTSFSNLGVLNYTPPAAPSVNASGLTVSNLTYNSLTLGWTNGNGQRRIVLARAFSPLMIAPANGVTYSASSNYSSGSNLGGAFVVYDGTGSTVNLTNLSPATQYNFAVYEYNGTGINSIYATTFLPGTATTPDFPTPTVSASNIYFTQITNNSMRVNWTRGNGNNCLLVARKDSAVSFIPSINTTYNSSTVFGSMDLGAGNYCILAAAGNSEYISNLQQGTTYYFAVFEYNSLGALVRYNLNVPVGNATTTALATPPTVAANSMTFQNLSPSSTRVSWVNGNGGKRLLLAIQGNYANVISAYANNGIVYTANSNYSSASPLASLIGLQGPYLSAKVVYNGTLNSVVVSGLFANTDYTYIVVDYNDLPGFPNSAAYLGSSVLFGTKRTDPNIQPPSMSASFPSSLENQNTIRFTWANGNGTNRIVVCRQGTPVNFVPSTNVNYVMNSNFSTGTDLGNGNKVVYNGAGSSVDVTGLLPYTSYHFVVYEYNTAFNTQTSTIDFAYRTASPALYSVKTSAPNWPRVAGGSDADASSSLGVDGNGNVYVTGIVRGTSAFGLNTLNANGVDIFIAKYNSTGDLIWVKNTGGADEQIATSILVESNGTFYIGGTYKGTATFDSHSLPVSRGEDGFLAKYNSSGIAQWVNTFGSDSQELVSALAFDNSGNILLAGVHAGITTFSGTTTTLTSNGKADALVAKYSNTGSLIWARGGGSASTDYAYGVGVDQNNNVYICGEIQGISTFGSLTTTYSGKSDAFFAQYNSAGTPQYINRYGSSGDDRAMYMDIDANGNVYLVGSFSLTTSFGSNNLTSSGITDGFILKITGASGAIQWAKKMGGIAQDIASGVDISSSGEIFVTGTFGDVAAFDGQSLTTTGNLDVFVASYTATGLVDVARKFGGPLDDAARGIYSVSGSNTYISGYFNISATFGGFDMFTKVQPAPPNGNWDIFVYNIGSTINLDPSADLVAWFKCNGNANDFSGNNYNGTIVAAGGTDFVTSVNDRNNTPNSAYQFGGTGRIEFSIPGNANLENLNEVTVMAWVNIGSFPLGSYKSIISGSNPALDLLLTPNRGIMGQTSDGMNAIGIAASPDFTYTQGTWRHIAMTYENGVQTRVLQNGSDVGTTPAFTSATFSLSSNTYTIGGGNTNPMNGVIDDIRIYKRALTPVQIQTIMNSASNASSPPMENGRNTASNEKSVLYPNPSNGTVTFEMVNENEQEISFRIIDISGNEVYSEPAATYDAGLVKRNFDLLNSPAGFYTLQVIKGGETSNYKLILNK